MKVLIAIDDSPFSEHVIEAISRRKWAEAVQFRVLTVIEPLSLEPQEKDWRELMSEVMKRRRDSAEKLLKHAREKLIAHYPEGAVHFEIREGAAKSEIIASAVEWQADKVLLGAHGHGICPTHVIGSVSRAVAAHAPCTVEIIRPRLASSRGESEARPKAHKH